MEAKSPHDISNSKSEKDDKITYNNNIRMNSGLCCVCHKPPAHSKNYYGHVFCKDCFYKYIFSYAKNESSGDTIKKETDHKEDDMEANEVIKEVVEDVA